MAIEFKVNAALSVDEFIGLLEASGLGERRPVHDRVCMEGMMANANLVVSACEMKGSGEGVKSRHDSEPEGRRVWSGRVVPV